MESSGVLIMMSVLTIVFCKFVTTTLHQICVISHLLMFVQNVQYLGAGNVDTYSCLLELAATTARTHSQSME